jgi:uncharacterized protein (TIGR02466 family)
MEVKELFPVPFFVFRNSEIDNEKLIAQLEVTEAPIHETTTLSMLVNLHNKPEFDYLFSWFRQCVAEVKDYMQFDCDELKISSSWFNVAMPDSGHFINYHRHSMSMLSAVYYATDGAGTSFEDPVIHRSQAQLEVLSKTHKGMETIEAEAGKLVIFPSWMFHQGVPHIQNTRRYIISFNVLPHGKINYNLAHDSRAHIEVKDD